MHHIVPERITYLNLKYNQSSAQWCIYVETSWLIQYAFMSFCAAV